jgi:PAS domain S-box-containing protein
MPRSRRSARTLIPIGRKRLRALDSVSTDPAVVRLVADLARCETCFTVSVGSLSDPFLVLRPVREKRRIVDFLYEYANEASAQASGVTAEELTGTRMVSRLAQLAPVGMFDAYVTVMETGNPLELDDFAPGPRRGDPEERRFDLLALRAGGLLMLRWRDVTERDRQDAEHARDATLVQLSANAIMSLDAELRVTAWNSGAEDVYGYSSEEILGTSSDVLIPADATPESRGLRETVLAGEDVAHYETSRLHKDGSLIDVSVTGFAQIDSAGDVAGVTTSTRDITERVQAEQALAESDGRYQEILDAIPDGVWRLDADGRTDYVNARMASMIGYSPEEMIGRSIFDFMPSADLEIAAAAITSNREQGRIGVVERTVLRKDGTSCCVRVSQRALIDARGKHIGGLAILSDITESRAQAVELSETLKFLAVLADSMTEGVCAMDSDGRITFMNRAAETLLGWTKHELAGRSVHDTIHLQHEDHSPYPAAECPLLDVLRTGRVLHVEDDTFTRQDGRLLAVSYSAAPIAAEGDIASVVVVFNDVSVRRTAEQQRQRERETMNWIGRIRDALDEDRLVLYTQPIIDVHTREVVKQELLLRMIDRDGTIICPGRFLPAAEQYGLIEEIDRWVLGQAIKCAAGGGLKVHFNISGKTLGSRELINDLTCGLRETGVNPALLVCEITETALADDTQGAEAYVHELSQLGCEIALDDFGTGYGGFTYLKRLPVAAVKIDVQFIQDLIENPQNQHVTRAIVNLAQGFECKTIAEGVETLATLDLLEKYGVDYAQGYAIGRPAPEDTLTPDHAVRSPQPRAPSPPKVLVRARESSEH